MSYSLYAPYPLLITGLVTDSVAPLDIATGRLTKAGHFTIQNLLASVNQGTGIGATATFAFATGFSGVGGLGVNAVNPVNLTTSNGLDYFSTLSGATVANGGQIVIRQTTNAGSTGVINFLMQVAPLP